MTTEKWTTDQLPVVSLDLRVPSEGDTLVKIDGQPVHGIQSLRVEMKAEDMIPHVTITFIAKQIVLESPKTNLTTERPVVRIPALSWDKKE